MWDRSFIRALAISPDGVWRWITCSILLISTILCAKFALNFLPGVPYAAWVLIFVAVFTFLNLHGIKTSARINTTLMVVMGVVIVIFLAAVARCQPYSARECRILHPTILRS